MCPRKARSVNTSIGGDASVPLLTRRQSIRLKDMREAALNGCCGQIVQSILKGKAGKKQVQYIIEIDDGKQSRRLRVDAGHLETVSVPKPTKDTLDVSITDDPPHALAFRGSLMQPRMGSSMGGGFYEPTMLDKYIGLQVRLVDSGACYYVIGVQGEELQLEPYQNDVLRLGANTIDMPLEHVAFEVNEVSMPILFEGRVYVNPKRFTKCSLYVHVLTGEAYLYFPGAVGAASHKIMPLMSYEGDARAPRQFMDYMAALPHQLETVYAHHAGSEASIPKDSLFPTMDFLAIKDLKKLGLTFEEHIRDEILVMVARGGDLGTWSRVVTTLGETSYIRLHPMYQCTNDELKRAEALLTTKWDTLQSDDELYYLELIIRTPSVVFRVLSGYSGKTQVSLIKKVIARCQKRSTYMDYIILAIYKDALKYIEDGGVIKDDYFCEHVYGFRLDLELTEKMCDKVALGLYALVTACFSQEANFMSPSNLQDMMNVCEGLSLYLDLHSPIISCIREYLLREKAILDLFKGHGTDLFLPKLISLIDQELDVLKERDSYNWLMNEAIVQKRCYKLLMTKQLLQVLGEKGVSYLEHEKRSLGILLYLSGLYLSSQEETISHITDLIKNITKGTCLETIYESIITWMPGYDLGQVIGIVGLKSSLKSCVDDVHGLPPVPTLSKELVLIPDHLSPQQPFTIQSLASGVESIVCHNKLNTP